MKKAMTLWFLLSLSIVALSQEPQHFIDSLLERIDTMAPKEKVYAHINIATQYQYLPNKFDSVAIHANKALEISNKNGFNGGKQMANYYLAMAAWYGKEDFELAKHHFSKTRDLIIDKDKNAPVYQIDMSIGTIEMMQGNYETALKTLQQAYSEALSHEDYSNLPIIASNLGNIYIDMNDTLSSIKIDESALEYSAKSQAPDKDITIVNIMFNLINRYSDTNQIQKAEKMLANARIKVDSMKVFMLETRLAYAEMMMMEKREDKEKLYKYVNQKLPLFENTQGYDNRVYTAMLYFKGREDAENGNYEGTKHAIKKLKKYIKNTDISHNQNLLKQIYDLNQQIGEYKEAYTYLGKFKNLNDSILSVKQKEKLIVIEKKYQLEKKDNEIKRKKVENLQLKRNNSLLFSGILCLFTIGLIGYLWYSRKRQKEESKVNQIEQKMLSLQMNPHFLFNAISSIQNYLFEEGDSKKAIHHLSTFATLMRQILENSRERFIPLEEEIQFLENYLNLQKLRFNDKFEYEINLADDIDPNALSIPPLLIQPFVENAIQHGKIYLKNGGLIKIEVSKYQEGLTIQIIDNGIGLVDSKPKETDDTMLTKKKSLSVSITNERLELLSKLMKKKFQLKINQNKTGEGTTVNLNVPTIDLN